MKAHHYSVRVTRRRFLSYLAVPAAMLFARPHKLLAVAENQQKNFHADNFGFADRVGLGPQIDAPTVQNTYVPLHREQLIKARIFKPEEVAAMKAALKSEFQYAGLRWSDGYELNYSFQHFGVPDDSPRGMQLLGYCERVYDYVYSRLNGLFEVDMSWRLLTSGREKLPWESSQFSAHIGRYTYYMMRVFIDDSYRNDLPSLINAQPLNRAIHYIIGGNQARPKHAHLYIIPGKTALVAPFSEILHLTFHAPSENYAEQLEKTVSHEQARLYAINAGETINEATAIVLAREYVSKYGSRERIASINDMANNLNNRFADLHNAISFIQRNGIQKSINIYLESPATFMRKIGNSPMV